MEIIDELEPERRGIYSGCVGYFSANGDMDTCIALRTAVVKDGKLYAQAGGGVVYDSTPQYEYEETVNKAAALFRAAEVALDLASEQKEPLLMLTLIDNYDSFTFNLVQFLGDLGADCHVVRNDKSTPDEIPCRQAERHYSVSPGPCDPDKAGICLDLIEAAPDDMPILGSASGINVSAKLSAPKSCVRRPSCMAS